MKILRLAGECWQVQEKDANELDENARYSSRRAPACPNDLRASTHDWLGSGERWSECKQINTDESCHEMCTFFKERNVWKLKPWCLRYASKWRLYLDHNAQEQPPAALCRIYDTFPFFPILLLLIFKLLSKWLSSSSRNMSLPFSVSQTSRSICCLTPSFSISYFVF